MSGALVLDCEGLSRAVRRERTIQEWLTSARTADVPVITSAAVIVEVAGPKTDGAALRWTLSRIRVDPVTQTTANDAANLLRTAGLHGHKYAIDAMLCATALAQPGPITILTSDVDDIAKLTAGHPRVAVERV